MELVLTSTGTAIGSGFAQGTSVSITTNNFAALDDGTYQVAARQRNSAGDSPLSPELTIVFDTTEPDSVIGSVITTGNVGRLYRSDLASSEEGAGLIYALTDSPTGATIDSTTGVIEWTPTSNQLGTNSFSVAATDLAGNVRSEQFNVEVADAPLAEVRLEITDLQNNPISSVGVGEEFLLRMFGVDARATGREGVFGAFADILFDNSLVRAISGSIDHEFPATNKGRFKPARSTSWGRPQRRLNRPLNARV